jgi:hypothetical protein
LCSICPFAKELLFSYEIRNSHSDEYVDSDLLGCDAMMFQRTVDLEDGGNIFLHTFGNDLQAYITS